MLTSAFTCTGPYSVLIMLGITRVENRSMMPVPAKGRWAVAGRPPNQWDEGYTYWWDLSEVVCFDDPIPCRGNVGMWQMPSALPVRVTEAGAMLGVPLIDHLILGAASSGGRHGFISLAEYKEKK